MRVTWLIEPRRLGACRRPFRSANTHGVGFHNEKVVVFGTAAAGSIGALPSHVEYRQLVLAAPGPTISKILDVSPYSDKLYVIARMSDNAVRHF